MIENNREAKHPVQEITDAVGGKIEEMGRLPDGSGFAVVSMPLPKDHWLTQDQEGFNTPPMPFRMGNGQSLRFWHYRLPIKTELLSRQDFADRIRAAGKYAIRASTMNGKEMDFDPDALLQNLVTGMLGYWTANGLSSDEWANPKERTKWCCEGDGVGGHHKKCRYSPDDSDGKSSPMQG